MMADFSQARANGVPPPNLGAVPPPPLEVKIRTMKSDLELLAASGGSLTQSRIGKTVKVVITSAAPRKGSKLILVLIIIAALALIAVAAYLVYRLSSGFSFLGGGAAPVELPPLSGNRTGSPPTPPTIQPPLAGPSPFMHKSLFRTPADQILTLNVPSGSTSQAANLQTFNQRILNLLKSVNPTSTIVEFDVQDLNKEDLVVSTVWSLAGTDVIDPAVLAAHFNPDATYFVYKDKTGFWPGYILALKPGDNWLFVEPDVAKLELSPKVPDFYLGATGTPSPDGFTDFPIGSKRVRIINFSNPTSTFIYGWFGNDLVLSTSINGLKEALTRL